MKELHSHGHVHGHVQGHVHSNVHGHVHGNVHGHGHDHGDREGRMRLMSSMLTLPFSHPVASNKNCVVRRITVSEGDISALKVSAISN